MALTLPRRTKIVATLGPATATSEQVMGLARGGMDGARLNFSHGTHEQHAEYAALVRAAQEEVGRPIALIADLQGPKLRIGELAQPILLDVGDQIVVTGDAPSRRAVARAPVRRRPGAPAGSRRADRRRPRPAPVESVEQGDASCVVVVGGLVSSHKGVNVPGVPVPIPAVTRKDADDLEFAFGLGVDFVALSFVRSAADVRDLKGLIDQAGSEAHVIAKIEKAEAVDSLVAILDETDAVMVARGDLGVEIGPEVVPLLQKRIIKAALDRGKPVITATQMLESMVHHPEPTRAEASDIANAILDGTSALMLSEETAIGEYPLETVKTMARIALAIEPSIEYRHQFPQPGDEPSVNQAMSNAACDLAETLGAKAILVPTFSGRTASVVARLKPRRPVIGLSHHEHALQHMALEWGVTPVRMPEAADVEELWSSSLESGRETGLLDEGDLVVLTAGTAVNIPGTTDMIKLAYA